LKRFPGLTNTRLFPFFWWSDARTEGYWSKLKMDKNTDDKLDPKAKGKKTPQADFDRNRDGLYGGLPKARDTNAPGPDAKKPHPSR